MVFAWDSVEGISVHDPTDSSFTVGVLIPLRITRVLLQLCEYCRSHTCPWSLWDVSYHSRIKLYHISLGEIHRWK